MPQDDTGCKPYEIVFQVPFGDGLMEVWPDTYPENLDAFVEDMDALGFAIWPTPTHIYVYVGESE